MRQALGARTSRHRDNRSFALDKWNVDAPFAAFAEVGALRMYNRIVCALRPIFPTLLSP